MELGILIVLVIFAFICEYIDSYFGMGYGTILTPILILAGFEPLVVIPSILFSQAVASFSAGMFHQKYRNISLNLRGSDSRKVFFIVVIGFLAIFSAVFLAIKLPQSLLELYIGIVLLVVSICLLVQSRYMFSWRKLYLIGFISVFNKAITGAGFGPVLTSGQMISGEKVKKAIGITTISEAPICIFSFISYVVLNGLDDINLLVWLSVGAFFATPLGPLRTKYLDEKNGRFIVGLLTLVLGVFIIIKNFIWSYVYIFLLNPFFWAFISLFAFIGSSVTLVSKKLGVFQRFNLLLVVIFFLGRMILVLPFIPQPRFELCGIHTYLGGCLFSIGLLFFIPLLLINPWPKPDAEVKLLTTGFYSVTRNPLYLGEILLSLGWAVMFQSIIGVALIPIWWAGFLFHVILEEEDLERKLGHRYLQYKKKVRGRIFPFLPI